MTVPWSTSLEDRTFPKSAASSGNGDGVVEERELAELCEVAKSLCGQEADAAEPAAEEASRSDVAPSVAEFKSAPQPMAAKKARAAGLADTEGGRGEQGPADGAQEERGEDCRA